MRCVRHPPRSSRRQQQPVRWPVCSVTLWVDGVSQAAVASTPPVRLLSTSARLVGGHQHAGGPVPCNGELTVPVLPHHVGPDRAQRQREPLPPPAGDQLRPAGRLHGRPSPPSRQQRARAGPGRSSSIIDGGGHTAHREPSAGRVDVRQLAPPDARQRIRSRRIPGPTQFRGSGTARPGDVERQQRPPTVRRGPRGRARSATTGDLHGQGHQRRPRGLGTRTALCFRRGRRPPTAPGAQLRPCQLHAALGCCTPATTRGAFAKFLWAPPCSPRTARTTLFVRTGNKANVNTSWRANPNPVAFTNR